MPPNTLDHHALDPASLDRLRAMLGTEESYQGILRDFLSSSALLGRRFEDALTRAPPPDLGLAAHTLKSMAQLLGAVRLAETCRAIEASSTAGGRPRPDQLGAALAHLRETRVAVGSLLR